MRAPAAAAPAARASRPAARGGSSADGVLMAMRSTAPGGLSV